MKNTQLHTLFALVSSAFLAACSSGGSGLAQQDTALHLTASTSSTTDINDAAYGKFFNTSLKGQVSTIHTVFNTDGVSGVAKTIWASPKAMQLITADFVNNATPTCTTGTVIRTFTDSNSSNTLDVTNEKHELVFTNCVNNGLTINGTVRYEVASVVTTVSTFNLVYSNFSVVQSGITYTVQGTKQLVADTLNGLDLTSRPTSQFSYNYVADSSNNLGVTTQETSYVSQFTETTNAWDMRLTGSMSFSYGGKTANLVLATATPISGTIAAGTMSAPTAGEHTIAWNSQHLKTVIDNTSQLTMSSDIDANGSYENTAYTVMWADLTATIPN